MSQTVVVTGANRGLGLELCRRFVDRGDRVIGTAREPEAAEALQSLDLRVEALDVADRSSVDAFAKRLGGEAVDVLINNAGAGVGRGSLGSLDEAEIRRLFEINALGPLRVTEALLPNLRASSRKLLAHMTSRMGSIADNTSGGSYAYRASKSALNMLHRSMSIDLAGEGFTSVVLHPGWVQTDMGGGAAPLTVEQSVEGLLVVLDGLTRDDNGAFIAFDGERLPW